MNDSKRGMTSYLFKEINHNEKNIRIYHDNNLEIQDIFCFAVSSPVKIPTNDLCGHVFYKPNDSSILPKKIFYFPFENVIKNSIGVVSFYAWP